MLEDLHIIMVKTRFPENVGMAARACANMGAAHIVLVDPELWDKEKARPLATAKGASILDGIHVTVSLPDALREYALFVGTTARTGGWRRDVLTPHSAAQEIVAALREGGRVALLFGPEDRGLNNEEIEHCQRLVTIPTAPTASSLNVAQSVLLLLYECFTAARADTDKIRRLPPPESRRITAGEQERLYASLRETLLRIDYLHGNNPDYFLMPLRRLLGRVGLRRHEYDALMGICRQVRNKIPQ